MIRASEDVVKMAYRLDNLKKFARNISDNAEKIAFPDESFSLFPLYMTFAKHVNFDVLEYEPEAVRKIVGNDLNADRINTVISTTARGDAWVNPTAFDMFTDAANGREINPEVLSPDYPGEIVFSLINLAGIDGSVALPVKTNVIKFIKACLDNDGWDVPPPHLFFKNLLDYYDQDHVEEIIKRFGGLSIERLRYIDYDEAKKNLSESEINYIARSQEVSEYIHIKYDKLMYDWTMVING